MIHAVLVCLSCLSLLASALAATPAQPTAISSTMSALPLSLVTKVPAASLHVSRPTWWLESRFHFSFADYWDPKRMQFGALRVVNDDLVKGHAGFGTHPHRDAEIFSYILDGQLSHADSMGSKESLPRGCIQYMSAGTGVTHSEMNDHAETCRFLQVWINPDRRGHQPQYGSSTFEPADRHNRLLQVLCGNAAGRLDWPGIHSTPSSCIKINQDANVLVSESDAGTTFDVPLAPSRQAYLVCLEGSLQVNGESLAMRDAAKIKSQDAAATLLTLKAGEPSGAHFLIIEMAKSDDA